MGLWLGPSGKRAAEQRERTHTHTHRAELGRRKSSNPKYCREPLKTFPPSTLRRPWLDAVAAPQTISRRSSSQRRGGNGVTLPYALSPSSQPCPGQTVRALSADSAAATQPSKTQPRKTQGSRQADKQASKQRTVIVARYPRRGSYGLRVTMMSCQIPKPCAGAPARGQLPQRTRGETSSNSNGNGNDTANADADATDDGDGDTFSGSTYLPSMRPQCVSSASSRRVRARMVRNRGEERRRSPLSDNGTSLLAKGRSGAIGQSPSTHTPKRTGHGAKFFAASPLPAIARHCPPLPTVARRAQSVEAAASEPSVAGRV
ncbi:hypothetical protein AOQ84DRAFT_435403 [Glonium stellatum]|uniref:Uncharacterized protein n=1 Tax=Glonium stellatum TaxID=574774 RepID=A0A8E2FDR7_9PEZI|nr:hypothetical protein AOQ84DRAFT_435403 [Glonium stellatum]